MTPRKQTPLLLAAIALLATGCGSSKSNAQAPATTDTHKTSTQTSETALKNAVRAAIRANVRLATYVLWHNQIPAWATRSTRGPALKALRDSAAARRRQGIQIKNLSGHYTITSTVLAPSYTGATAVINSHQRVAPYKGGRRLGRAIVGNDHARIRLRRLDNTSHFIVWTVSPIR
jgi:hypothetical protein